MISDFFFFVKFLTFLFSLFFFLARGVC